VYGDGAGTRLSRRDHRLGCPARATYGCGVTSRII